MKIYENERTYHIKTSCYIYMVAVASPAMMNGEKVDTVDNKWTVDVAEFNFAQNLTKRYAIDVTASKCTIDDVIPRTWSKFGQFLPSLFSISKMKRDCATEVSSAFCFYKHFTNFYKDYHKRSLCAVYGSKR